MQCYNAMSEVDVPFDMERIPLHRLLTTCVFHPLPPPPPLLLLLFQTLMLVSSATRPLLGCVWNFPSSYSGLAYATTSMVIHEAIPIILMAFTNLGSLYTLYTHSRVRSSAQDAPVMKRVPAERRAAKVRKTRVAFWLLRAH